MFFWKGSILQNCLSPMLPESIHLVPIHQDVCCCWPCKACSPSRTEQCCSLLVSTLYLLLSSCERCMIHGLSAMPATLVRQMKSLSKSARCLTCLRPELHHQACCLVISDHPNALYHVRCWGLKGACPFTAGSTRTSWPFPEPEQTVSLSA